MTENKMTNATKSEQRYEAIGTLIFGNHLATSPKAMYMHII